MTCRVTLDTWVPRPILYTLAIAIRHVPDTCMGTRETTEDGIRESSKAGSDHLLVITLRSDMGLCSASRRLTEMLVSVRNKDSSLA
jgi:hypothetical protein